MLGAIAEMQARDGGNRKPRWQQQRLGWEGVRIVSDYFLTDSQTITVCYKFQIYKRRGKSVTNSLVSVIQIQLLLTCHLLPLTVHHWWSLFGYKLDMV